MYAVTPKHSFTIVLKIRGITFWQIYLVKVQKYQLQYYTSVVHVELHSCELTVIDEIVWQATTTCTRSSSRNANYVLYLSVTGIRLNFFGSERICPQRTNLRTWREIKILFLQEETRVVMDLRLWNGDLDSCKFIVVRHQSVVC